MDVKEIRQERIRQNDIWGGKGHDQWHSDIEWMGFIRERIDDVAYRDISNERRRELLIHIAALAVAAIEIKEHLKGDQQCLT